jgi:hypothetical protein
MMLICSEIQAWIIIFLLHYFLYRNTTQNDRECNREHLLINRSPVFTIKTLRELKKIILTLLINFFLKFKSSIYKMYKRYR